MSPYKIVYWKFLQPVFLEEFCFSLSSLYFNFISSNFTAPVFFFSSSFSLWNLYIPSFLLYFIATFKTKHCTKLRSSPTCVQFTLNQTFQNSCILQMEAVDHLYAVAAVGEMWWKGTGSGNETAVVILRCWIPLVLSLRFLSEMKQGNLRVHWSLQK